MAQLIQSTVFVFATPYILKMIEMTVVYAITILELMIPVIINAQKTKQLIMAILANAWIIMFRSQEIALLK